MAAHGKGSVCGLFREARVPQAAAVCVWLLLAAACVWLLRALECPPAFQTSTSTTTLSLGHGDAVHMEDILIGGAALELALAACPVAADVVATGMLVDASIDMGLWFSFTLIDGFEPRSEPRSVKLAEAKLTAPASLLKGIHDQLRVMNESFTGMQFALVGMTKQINKRNWPEVAAKSDLATAKARGFVVAAKMALRQVRCQDALNLSTTCQRHYYVCSGSDCTSRGCLVEEYDCYAKCCRQQEDYCDTYETHEQCLYERGCGKHQHPEKPFRMQVCEVLQDTDVKLQTALAEIKSMRDCAVRLGQGREASRCSPEFEKKVRGEVKADMHAAQVDLQRLSKLYHAATPEVLAAAPMPIANQSQVAGQVKFLAKSSSSPKANQSLAAGLAAACHNARLAVPECSRRDLGLERSATRAGTLKLGPMTVPREKAVPLCILATALLLLIAGTCLVASQAWAGEPGPGAFVALGGPNRDPLLLVVLVLCLLLTGLTGAAILYMPAPTAAQGQAQTMPACEWTQDAIEQIYASCEDLWGELQASEDLGDGANATLSKVVVQLMQSVQDLVQHVRQI